MYVCTSNTNHDTIGVVCSFSTIMASKLEKCYFTEEKETGI